MQLKVIGSGSSGNCYLLEGETSALVIEAGVHPMELKKAIGFNISKIVGVMSTHSHLDHCKYLNDFSKSGIKVYASPEVIDSRAISGPNVFLFAGKVEQIGDFKVLPFEVEHDVPCFGFLIHHEEMGNILFVTDTHYIKYTFDNLDHIMVECNYDQEILDDNILNGRLPAIVRSRVMKSHMSIDTAEELIKANDTSNVKNIVLIHSSEGNSDKNAMCERIRNLTGKRTYVAEKGLTLNFNKFIF
jgi:phosphoribosyl 1,2-cyclic phosphodiesterase